MTGAGPGWLEGHVALVTGGASGLGGALVRRFVAEGANVVALDCCSEKLTELVGAVPGVVGVPGDVRSLEDNERAVAAALGAFGGLDVLVANAGIWDYQVGLLELPAASIDEAFDEIFHVNVKGYLLALRAAAPALRESRGSAVLTLSNAAFYPDGGGPLYTASKHAALGLLRQLAYELAPHVRVNGVAPGAMATGLRGPAALGQAGARLYEAAGDWDLRVRPALPLDRIPTVEDMTSTYVLLASREASRATTGAVVNCDGGIGVRGVFGPGSRRRATEADRGELAASASAGEEARA